MTEKSANPDPPPEKKRGRIARTLRTVRQVKDEPRSAVGLLRGWLLDLWLSRGGGFYGLGFVITFVIMEVSFFLGDFSESDSVVGFVAQEALAFVFRFGYQSVINLVMALIWPVFLLNQLGNWGFAVLAAGYFGFEYLLRPLLEDNLPELREARLSREKKKQDKQAAKRLRKEQKKARK